MCFKGGVGLFYFIFLLKLYCFIIRRSHLKIKSYGVYKNKINYPLTINSSHINQPIQIINIFKSLLILYINPKHYTIHLIILYKTNFTNTIQNNQHNYHITLIPIKFFFFFFPSPNIKFITYILILILPIK